MAQYRVDLDGTIRKNLVEIDGEDVVRGFEKARAVAIEYWQNEKRRAEFHIKQIYEMNESDFRA